MFDIDCDYVSFAAVVAGVAGDWKRRLQALETGMEGGRAEVGLM